MHSSREVCAMNSYQGASHGVAQPPYPNALLRSKYLQQVWTPPLIGIHHNEQNTMFSSRWLVRAHRDLNPAAAAPSLSSAARSLTGVLGESGLPSAQVVRDHGDGTNP